MFCVLGLLLAWVAISGASTCVGWFLWKLSVGAGERRRQGNVCRCRLTKDNVGIVGANGVKVVAVVLDGVDCADLFGGPAWQQGAQGSVGCRCCFGVGRPTGDQRWPSVS